MEAAKESKVIYFDEVRGKILEELDERLKKTNIHENVTLLDGFLNEPFAKELSRSFIIGGPTVPMIMVIGNESGQVHLFALKVLLRDIEL